MKPECRPGLAAVFLVVLASSSRCIGQESPHVAAEAEKQRQRSLESVVKLDDHPLYQMTWYGDYTLIDPPARSQPSDSADGDFACTLFAAMGNRGQVLAGRNFDWQHNPALILFTDTSTGFATVTMVDISYLGYEIDDSDFDTLEGRTALLRAPLIPFDGLNDQGLFVGMAAVDESSGPFDEGRPTVGSLQMIRLILDQCRTTDEAVQMFDRYNIDFSGGPNIHYLIADTAGRSAVVELCGNELRVTGNEHAWQVATNFCLAPNKHRANGMCDRFARITRALEAAGGAITIPRSLELLGDVAQPNTRWSCVYDSQQSELHLVMSRNFDRPLRLKLSDHRPVPGE
jgi:Acyl-coenzyme A:6-aminopenicillanic acid acyl-transferase